MTQNSLDAADFLQRFSVKVLWHFTGYNKLEVEAFNCLVSIAKNCCLMISKNSHAVRMPNGEERKGYRSSCLCDIPFKDLRLHIMRYGGFGIAFAKKSAIEHGNFNPVLYVHKDHIFLKHADKILPELEILARNNKELSQKISEYLLMIGTYVKRSDLTNAIHLDPAVDSAQDNNFYYEREWRSAYDWNFSEQHVVTAMMPKNYIKRFKDEIRGSKGEGVFNDLSIFSTDMVDLL